jgi:hypothetical protein
VNVPEESDGGIVPMSHSNSKEAIAANVKALIEQLEAGHSEVLTAYLTAMGRFHNYSFGNILEIARQKAERNPSRRNVSVEPARPESYQGREGNPHSRPHHLAVAATREGRSALLHREGCRPALKPRYNTASSTTVTKAVTVAKKNASRFGPAFL